MPEIADTGFPTRLLIAFLIVFAMLTAFALRVGFFLDD